MFEPSGPSHPVVPAAVATHSRSLAAYSTATTGLTSVVAPAPHPNIDESGKQKSASDLAQQYSSETELGSYDESYAEDITGMKKGKAAGKHCEEDPALERSPSRLSRPLKLLTRITVLLPLPTASFATGGCPSTRGRGPAIPRPAGGL